MSTNSYDVIDNDLLSQEAFKQYLINFVKSRPNSKRWLDFYESSSGLIILELISALGVFKAFHETVNRRESYLQDAEVLTSGRAISETLGYSVNRGHNIHVTLTVNPSSTMLLEKYSRIGTYQGYDLVNLTAIALTQGVAQDIVVVLGDLSEETQYYTSDEVSVLRFENEDITEDYRLLLNDTEVPYSNIFTDLANGKFVTLTNANNSVDVWYLNNAVRETTNIKCKAASTLSGGEYLLLNSPSTNYCVYFTVDGVGADPAISSRTSIQVILLSTDSDQDVANKLSVALNGVSDFTADYQNAIVTVICTVTGTVNDAVDYNSGFTINVIAQGVDLNYIYNTGSALTIEYIERNSISSFVYGDAVFNYGTILDGHISVDKQSYEVMDSIKVNAPYYHETQKVIRGREDYKKVFKTLDSNLADVNGRDFSTAVVQLTYVKDDQSFYSETQRGDLKIQLDGYRAFGVSPLKGVENPEKVHLDLLIEITSSSNVTVIQGIQSDCEQILEDYQKVLQATLSLADIEEDIEQLPYVKIARIYPAVVDWDFNKAFQFKQFIENEDDENLIYENEIIYKSGSWPYATGFGFYTETDGSATSYQTTHIVIPDISLSGKEYFTINAPTIDYYVWYNVDGESIDPAPGNKTGIEVDVFSTDTNILIANKTKTALELTGDFTVTQISESLIVTTVDLGVCVDTADGPSEPAWTKTIGELIEDNRVVWECTSQSSALFSLPEMESEVHTLTAIDIANKYVPLSKTPNDPTDVLCIIVGGTVQEYGVDFFISTTNIRAVSWNGYALDGTLSVGDQLHFVYSVLKDRTEVYTKHEVFTLTAQHMSDKGIVLDQIPFERNDVILYTVGGTIQEYGVDFFITGTNNTFLSWNGYALDGTLSVGDQLAVYYLIDRDYGQYQRDTIYIIGDRILPAGISGTKIYECVGYINKSGLVEPIWNTTIGSLTNDNELIWQAIDFDSSIITDWSPSTRKNTGDKINPTDSSGVTDVTYVCVGYRGYSSGTAITLPTTVGQYIYDNQLKWTCRNKNLDPLSNTTLLWNQYYEIDFEVSVS